MHVHTCQLCRLTPYLHIFLWALMSLYLGCDSQNPMLKPMWHSLLCNGIACALVSLMHWTMVSNLRTEMLFHGHCSYIPSTVPSTQMWLGFSYSHFSACLLHQHTQQSSFSLRPNFWHKRQSDLKDPGVRSKEALQATETCTQWGWWTQAMATDRIRTAKQWHNFKLSHLLNVLPIKVFAKD